MSGGVAARGVLSLPGRLLGLLRDVVVGTLLCLNPVTSIIALGWLTRRMTATVARRWGRPADSVGWVLGHREAGWITFLLGGLAANIRTGVITVAGLGALTLPFTVLWLGAWWAGWENSFNKGYEQASVGPLVWFAGALLAMAILTHLPFALAHAAAEQRFGAFFEVRRIRSVAAAAGWRCAWLALLSVLAAVPLFGMRAIPVFVEGVVPGFADMGPEAQAQVAQGFALLAAALAFCALHFLRHRAAVIYSRAVPRAAQGRWAHLWADHPVAGRVGEGRGITRIGAAIWLAVSMLMWFGLVALIVMGQFMNYDAALWVTHPLFLLPWSG